MSVPYKVVTYPLLVLSDVTISKNNKLYQYRAGVDFISKFAYFAYENEINIEYVFVTIVLAKSNVKRNNISITTTSSQITFDEDIKIKPTFNLYSEYAVNHDNSEIIYNTAVNEDDWIQYEEGANIQCPDSNVIGYEYQIEISEGNI